MIKNTELNQYRKKPVAWSVTCDGKHVGNLFHTEEDACFSAERLQRIYPADKRTVEPLFTHSLEAADALQSLERVPTTSG